MKQNVRRFAGLLALFLPFFVLPTVAEAGGHGGPRRPPPKIPYTGIVSVDTSAMTITVAPQNSNATGSKTYKFTAKTKITVKGHPGTVADLAPGLQIHVGAGMNPEIAEELTATEPPPDPVVPSHGSTHH